MKRLQNHYVGADQGEVIMFSDFENNGEMWTGTGDRSATQEVKFSESFRTPPIAQVFMTMWDFDGTTNTRGDIRAVDVMNDGFKIEFQTWGDTRVARLRVGWTAIGELRHADEWALY